MFMNSHLGHPAWFWSYVGTLNCQESWLFVDKFRYQLKQLKILKSKCNELKCRFRKLYSNHSNFNDHYPSIPSLTLTSRMAPLEYNTRLGPVCIFDILKYSGIIKLAMTHCRCTTIEKLKHQLVEVHGLINLLVLLNTQRRHHHGSSYRRRQVNEETCIKTRIEHQTSD